MANDVGNDEKAPKTKHEIKVVANKHATSSAN